MACFSKGKYNGWSKHKGLSNGDKWDEKKPGGLVKEFGLWPSDHGKP